MTLFVALTTFPVDEGETLIEAGGVYVEARSANVVGDAYRLLVEGEAQAECPRCGQTFAATVDESAEACRDLHFDGDDDDIPSICRNLRAQLELV
jgi:hypothetical protein